MTEAETLALLETHVAAARGMLSGGVAGLADGELVAAGNALGRVLRDTQALLASVAGEVSRRSRPELGREGLAKRHGYASPGALMASSTGGSTASGSRLATVGAAAAARRALTGEELPPAHPHVAAALTSGVIGVDASAAIVAMLDRAAPRVDTGVLDEVERIVVERAAGLPLDLLHRLLREAEARLDDDGVAPREEEARAARSLTFRQDEHGMVRMVGVLDVETAAPIKRAVEAVVTHGVRSQRPRFTVEGGCEAGPTAGPVVADERSIPQRQADALAMIARHVIGCSRVPTVAAATLVVRADVKALTGSAGHGEVDGFDAPVSAGTVRRLAASAGVIPAVLGTDSLPLDLGRTARLFTAGQRIALAERDGGCACCGLDAAYTEAHHIAWWERDTGTTDLDNGVLLCPACHMRVHNDGWRIQIRQQQPWFIPPRHVDPQQKPRPGGKERFRLPRHPDPGGGRDRPAVGGFARRPRRVPPSHEPTPVG